MVSDNSEESVKVDSDKPYKGTYPLEQLNLVRESLKKDFVDAPCRCRAEFMLKLKLGIINDEIIEYFKSGKTPEGLPDQFEFQSRKEYHVDTILG